MKDIIELAFFNECKFPVAEVDGKHLFCAQPTTSFACPYCAEHVRRTGRPTKFYGDSKALADFMAGGLSRGVEEAEKADILHQRERPVDEQVARTVAVFDHGIVHERRRVRS